MAFDPVYFSIACGAHFTGLTEFTWWSELEIVQCSLQLILQSTKRQGGQK